MKKNAILLVEDDPNDEELILRVLRNRGLGDNVVVAHNGKEAMDILFPDPTKEGIDLSVAPYLIILDLKLPKMGGLEVLQALRVHNQTRLIPVVVFTSSIEQTDVLASYDLGANSYVRKPVEYKEFNETLKSMIDYWLDVNVAIPS